MAVGEILELPSYCGKNPVLVYKSAKYPGTAIEWCQKRLHYDGSRTYYCKHCREVGTKKVAVVRYRNGKFCQVADDPEKHICGYPNDSHLYMNIRENRRKTELKRVSVQTDDRKYLMFFDGFRILTGKYKFEVVQILGQGFFAKVAEVEDLNGEKGKHYALKISRNERSCHYSAENEVKMLKMLKKCEGDGKE
uniref:Protein kinase domain-containing protein n=1 Tax=Panagrolaimus sp. JU765 TaxID=591449 RepID=A0AC34QUE5_9BILA